MNTQFVLVEAEHGFKTFIGTKQELLDKHGGWLGEATHRWLCKRLKPGDILIHHSLVIACVGRIENGYHADSVSARLRRVSDDVSLPS